MNVKTKVFILFVGLMIGSCAGKSNESAAEDAYNETESRKTNEEDKEVSSLVASQSVADTIIDIYVSDEQHTIFYDIPNEKRLTLRHEENHVFSILYKTSDNKWLIVEKAPSEPGVGRIETEHVLFCTPEARHIDIELLNPDLHNQGMHFAMAFNELHLIAYLKGSFVPVPVSFKSLIEGREQTIPDVFEFDNVPKSTGNEKVIVELMLGKGEDQIGQGVTSLQLEDGSIYAVPSFAAHGNILYIVDAINFRVLMYDFSGDFIKSITYPQKTDDGNTVIIKDIAVDNEFIYLLSSSGAYVVNAEAEKIIEKIDKPGPSSESFRYPDYVQVGLDGNLYVFDYATNKMYTFQKSRQSFKFIESENYRNAISHLANKEFSASAYGEEEINLGRYFMIRRNNNSAIGIYDSGYSKCQANVFATDQKGNIYVVVDEIEQLGAQFPGARTLRVISPEGNPLYSLEVKSWPGGPMNRHLIVTKTGKIFEAFYDLETGFEEEPASKLTVKKIK